MSRSVHQPRYTVALTAADVGERVMIRYAPGTGQQLTDAVGDLLSWYDGRLRVATRTGVAEVTQDALVAAKLVPSPRLAHAADASLAEVQRMSSLSWQALETERLGGWRLRAGGGFTGRANSVLPLGDPGRPLDDAIRYVEQWYEQRGLLPRFQLPLPDSAELSSELADRGWRLLDAADVLVGDVGPALAAAGERVDLPAVDIAASPSEGWLAGYHYRGGRLPVAGRDVLSNHSHAGFATVTVDGEVVAIARAALDSWWLGFSAVEVAAGHRRLGLGRHVMAGLLRWGLEQGTRYAHLQVAVDNAAAHALYAGLGLTRHHGYHYRVRG